jgi:hypothetical protein
VRLAWIVALACSCGRIKFDAVRDGSTDAPDIGYFVSPTGSDGNPGTRALPWGTLPFALGQLHPGDTLNLLDGDYDGHSAVGSLRIDCSANAMNGTATAPITVRADHPRRAHVYNTTSPLHVQYCSYWTFDGFWLDALDDSTDIYGAIAMLYYNDHLSVRGLLLQHVNRYNNNSVLELGYSTNTLVEESEAYDYFRTGFVMYRSTGTTFRKLYANGRGSLDIAGGATSTCPGGDNGFDAYYDSGGTIEDTIVEDICEDAYAVDAGRGAAGSTDIGDHHHYYNAIALGPAYRGFAVVSDCDATAPCDTPDRYASDNSYAHVVTIGFTVGFELQGVATSLDHVTAFARDASSTLVTLDVEDPLGGLAASATLSAALGNGGNLGISSANQTTWSVDHSNIFGAAQPYVPNDAHVTASTTIDPLLGGCEVYIPATSSMAMAGPSGTTIGADIRTLTLDGNPTTDPFWLADGTFAGCGAIVPGVNDDPATACIGVHQRLNVGSGGCALP